MTPAAVTPEPPAVSPAAELDLAAARLFRVLGNPTRLGILQLLAERPRTVSELIDRLGCSPSRVSNHLACLRWCGFVEAERWGRTVTYSICDRRVVTVLASAREVASDHCHHLASCTRIGPDWV